VPDRDDEGMQCRTNLFAPGETGCGMALAAPVFGGLTATYVRSRRDEPRVCQRLPELSRQMRCDVSTPENFCHVAQGFHRQGAQVSTIQSKPNAERAIIASQSVLTGSGRRIGAPAFVPSCIPVLAVEPR
jgi:hypothetical protein